MSVMKVRGCPTADGDGPSTICSAMHARETVQRLVDRLADARLLVTSGSSVEIVHDALLREWPVLRNWLREDRHFRLWRQEIERRSVAWIETEPDNPKQRDEGRLLRGRDLTEGEDWLGKRGDELREEERQFIRASKAIEERRTRRLAALATVLGVLLVAAVAGVIWASWQTNQAQLQADLALTRQLLARSSGLQENQPDASLLVNVEALQRAPATIKEEARFDLLSKLTQPYHVARQLAGHTDSVNEVAFSPDGKLIASPSDDKTVRLWNVASGKQFGEPVKGNTEPVYGVAFSPDGKLLASAGENDEGGTVRLWDVASGKQLGEPLEGDEERELDVEFSPDGKLLASA